MVEEKKEKEITLTGRQLSELLGLEKAKFSSLNQRLNELQAIISETKGCVEALKELGKQKNAKALVPLGSGVLVDATIESAEDVKTTLPGNVIIKQNREQASKSLEKSLEEASRQLEELQKEQQQTIANSNNLANIIQAAQQQVQKQKQQ